MHQGCWYTLTELRKGVHVVLQTKIVIQKIFERKDPACKTDDQKWVYVTAAESIIQEVNAAFVQGQGLKTLIWAA